MINCLYGGGRATMVRTGGRQHQLTAAGAQREEQENARRPPPCTTAEDGGGPWVAAAVVRARCSMRRRPACSSSSWGCVRSILLFCTACGLCVSSACSSSRPAAAEAAPRSCARRLRRPPQPSGTLLPLAGGEDPGGLDHHVAGFPASSMQVQLVLQQSIGAIANCAGASETRRHLHLLKPPVIDERRLIFRAINASSFLLQLHDESDGEVARLPARCRLLTRLGIADDSGLSRYHARLAQNHAP